jgi:ADP-dependent NAD(P)H-hydrate dehydratase / NAD(P)H-hydrate epimerase
MIILNEQQIKAWDAYTIEKGVPALQLMEQAANAVVDRIDLLMGEEDQEVLILCGNGNNGADGLAIARLLVEMDYIVDIYVNLEGEHSPEWKANYERLVNLDPEQLEIHTSWNPEAIELSPSGTILDAMFGTGLSRPLEGIWKEIANWVNEQSNLTVAVDMPSGLYVDKAPEGEVVYADLVLTFQCQRLAFMMPESEPYMGNVLVCNIGLNDSFLLEYDIRTFELTDYYLIPFLNERNRFSHKGDYGHGFLIAGSVGKGGAAILASAAAMRSGLGLLTTHVPLRLYAILQTAIPEAMVSIDQHQDHFTHCILPEKVSAIGIGPGLGMNPDTIAGLERLLTEYAHLPMVIDADALNILALRPDLFDKLAPGTIITPHPGEFDRLFGEQEDHYARFHTAVREAQHRKINIVLKGGVTIICQANGVSFFNTKGNPGMATGGSGDVLTGVILGLLCQGYSPDYAALLGVYIHAAAGDLAADDQGLEALIASDIVEYLGDAFEELRHRTPDVTEEEEKDA